MNTALATASVGVQARANLATYGAALTSIHTLNYVSSPTKGLLSFFIEFGQDRAPLGQMMAA